MQFSAIPGLAEIKKSLIDSHKNNHIAHAQLFYGIEGGGSLPLALAFATYLLCLEKNDGDSCGVCSNCSKMKKLVHPDVHFFFPKISSGSVKDGELDKTRQEAIKVWRQLVPENPFLLTQNWINANGYDNKNVLISKEDSRQVIQTVSMKSFEGGFKIVLIWCPEYMNPSAANALLKVIEEPPAQTIYLMVTHEIEVILPTIKSRTQLFTIPPFGESEISEFLVSKFSIKQEIASQLSRVADGSLGFAIAESQLDSSVAYGHFQMWMRECLGRDFTRLSSRAEDFAKSGKSVQRNDLNFALNLIRESILAKSRDESLISRSGEEKQFIINFSKAVSLESLEKIYELISECLMNLARNANARISHLNLSIHISQLIAKR